MPGDKVFDVDMPVLIGHGTNTVRRFLKLEISLPDKSEFLKSLTKKPKLYH
jgi:hypothetical protein